MGWYENRTEMARYIAELKQLLAGTALSPDARARALAALIEADAMTQAADQMHTAAEIARDDTMPVLLRAAQSFGDKAASLAWALPEPTYPRKRSFASVSVLGLPPWRNSIRESRASHGSTTTSSAARTISQQTAT